MVENSRKVKIGVFDSGVGGLFFVDAIKTRFPDVEVVYKEDHANLPYGKKTVIELYKLALPIFKSFESESCDVVVVACNTVTTTIIDKLRLQIKIPLVGVEPMIKTASQVTKTNNIAVCATEATLRSGRFKHLKKSYANNMTILEPDCSEWADMIQQNSFNLRSIQKIINEAKQANVDTIVLGCTHYHWIQKQLQHLAGKDIQIIQPTGAVLDRLQDIIQDLGLSL